MTRTEVILIGAGPIGLEMAVALKTAGVAYIHLEAGQVGQTIGWYPRQAKFFSSPERIALAGLPLQTPNQDKATREEYLAHLRSVVTMFDLEIRTFERVTAIEPQPNRDDGLLVRTLHADRSQVYRAQHVIYACGDMHHPRVLHVPGEDLPHVSHYFVEPHQYFRQRLLIVGGGNSAVEAALRCHHSGARVTVSYRRAEFNAKAIKYWLLPEINWLITRGDITFHNETEVVAIDRAGATLRHRDGASIDVPADFILLLTGYVMDTALLEAAGVQLIGENRAPKHDHQTMETNVPGLYVAGTAAAGTQLRFRLFIENCHPHVVKILRHIAGADPVHINPLGYTRLKENPQAPPPPLET